MSSESALCPRSVISGLAGTPLRVCDLFKFSYFVRVCVLSARCHRVVYWCVVSLS